MDIIVGTAGHIDHGKTALVKALTGVDADRLPEEKQRGITIDLGFAEMRAGDVGIGFVDVPGHERFVKNMLAGASGIDLVLLVVAADEGVMPQTREHFDICRLLKIRNGLIVLTKIDLVDDETLELARLDVAELVSGSFLDGAPVFAVSSRSGGGMEELRDGLASAATQVRREKDVYETRLAIDRSFSIRGFGAVVTGTLASGLISEGDELELSPPSRPVRVRGIQTHGKSVGRAHAGQRTAVNLASIGHEEIERGMTLATPGTTTVTQAIDVEIEMLADSPRPLRSRQRVRVHLGTAEVLARVSVLEDGLTIEADMTGFAQLRLESPVVTVHNDRFIIRSYSPQRTIGGGRVLDPAANRHRRSHLTETRATLERLSDADKNVVETFVTLGAERGISRKSLRERTGLRNDVLSNLIARAIDADTVIDAEGLLISRSAFETLASATLNAIDLHHRGDKLSRGLSRETLREKVFGRTGVEVFRVVTNSLVEGRKIVFDQDVFKLASHDLQLSPAETAARDEMRKLYVDAGLEAPKLEDVLRDVATRNRLDQKSARKIFQLLVNAGELVPVTPEFYLPSVLLTDLTAKIRESARVSGDPTIDVGKFKEIAGVSRKYAIPLLEYFDRTRVTRRVGDKRQVL